MGLLRTLVVTLFFAGGVSCRCDGLMQTPDACGCRSVVFTQEKCAFVRKKLDGLVLRDIDIKEYVNGMILPVGDDGGCCMYYSNEALRELVDIVAATADNPRLLDLVLHGIEVQGLGIMDISQYSVERPFKLTNEELETLYNFMFAKGSNQTNGSSMGGGGSNESMGDGREKADIILYTIMLYKTGKLGITAKEMWDVIIDKKFVVFIHTTLAMNGKGKLLQTMESHPAVYGLRECLAHRKFTSVVRVTEMNGFVAEFRGDVSELEMMLATILVYESGKEVDSSSMAERVAVFGSEMFGAFVQNACLV